MQGLYLLWFVQERQLSPALVATVLAAGDLALVALELPTGWFADRVGHRTSLALGSSVQIAGMLCCWLGEGVPALIAASLLVALGDAFRSGADQALLYRSCVACGREKAFQPILARTAAIEQAALVALVIAGGAIVHAWGFAAGWAAETLLCVAGFAIALRMVEPPPAATPDEADAPPSATAPIVSVRMLGLILPAAMLGAWASLVSFLMQTGGGTGAARMSILVAAIALAEAAGTATAAYISSSTTRRSWILAAVGLACAGVAMIAPATLFVSALALSLLAGVAHPLRAAAIQRVAVDASRARAASAATACDMLLSTITLPLGGVWRTRRRR